MKKNICCLICVIFITLLVRNNFVNYCLNNVYIGATAMAEEREYHEYADNILTFLRMTFKPNQVVGEKSSPNGQYSLAIVSSDQGATGGDIRVYLDKMYLNTFKYRKTVYYNYTATKDNISWIDNKTYNINGHINKLDKNLA